MNYQSPFTRSYWAIPAQVLAGCYPGARHATGRDEKLNGLIQAGVTLVVNLMEASETDHQGNAFVDYLPRLQELAETAGRQIRAMRFEIPDGNIPSLEEMNHILAAILEEMDRGGVVYVHCWGGKGRTATVIGCLLVQLGLESSGSVLQRLLDLTVHASQFFWPTPQTPEQCDFIVQWKGSAL
ncbi:hypothetical protein BH09VER1_BH09VER1_26610 [soil metagenome]